MVKRFRKRYVLYRVLCENDGLGKDSVRKAIYESFFRFFGFLGLSQARLIFIDYDENEKVGILACSHRFLELVRVSLALISQIDGKKVNIYTVRVSGTIKSLREFKARIARKT